MSKPSKHMYCSIETILQDESLDSRTKKQQAAKAKLTEVLGRIYEPHKVQHIIENELRDNQYLFFLALIDTIVLDPKDIFAVLEAVMNGGKSHTITNLFPVVFDLLKHHESDLDTLYIMSYKKEVVKQFQRDITKPQTLEKIAKFYNDSGRSLFIVCDEPVQETRYANVHCVQADDFTRIKKFVGEHDLLLLSNLNVLLPTSTQKKPIIEKVLENRKAVCIADEVQSALALVYQECGASIFNSYKAVMGFDNPTYKGALMHALRSIDSIKFIVGMTGTVTAAHKHDDHNFHTVPALITKQETSKYTKQAKVHYVNDALERLDLTISLFKTKDKKYPNRKCTAVLLVPNDDGYDSTSIWEDKIMRAVRNFGYNRSNVLFHYDKKTGMPMLSVDRVVDMLEDWNSPIKFLVVKRAFSAGVNVKNIVTMTTLKDTIPRCVIKAKAFHNILQTLMRPPRWYTGVENNAGSWDDVISPMGRELNTVDYVLPEVFKPVVEILDESFLDLQEIHKPQQVYNPTDHDQDLTTNLCIF